MSMKRCAVMGLISLLAVNGMAQADPVEEEDPFYPEVFYGWYEGGVAIVDDANIQDFFGNAVSGNSVRFNQGFHFGIGIGQYVTRYVKFEVESGFNYNALDSIQGATASSGNLYRVPIMGNVVLQLPNRTGFVPVIGAGVGAQWMSFDAQNVSLGTTTLNEDSETWVFSYQGFAGIRYEFHENFNLGIFYRYNVADGPSWDFGSTPGNFKLNDVRTHSFSITLGWWF